MTLFVSGGQQQGVHGGGGVAGGEWEDPAVCPPEPTTRGQAAQQDLLALLSLWLAVASGLLCPVSTVGILL